MSELAAKKTLIERVVNAFESGSAAGDYGLICIYDDGKNRSLQITYGRAQTTEQGNLRELVGMYIPAGGVQAGGLAPYLPKIGKVPLFADGEFKRLLHDAGADPVMRRVQDLFFEKRYWLPALAWARENAFTLPLSMLVIYDSFVHSGCIHDFLRRRFSERVPVAGGVEKEWIEEYVDTRHHWLRLHSNPGLRKTIYRTSCFKREIARNNWNLEILPIDANGTPVNG